MTHTKKVKKIAQIANTFLHDCANVIWDMKEAKRVLAFHLDQFPLSMNFHYIINYANIFHLKSSGSNGFSHFLTSHH